MGVFQDPKCPCPFCGGTAFSSGHLRAGHRLDFVADEYPTLERMFGGGKAGVSTRICNNCRHLDLFAPDFEPEEGDSSGVP